MGKTVNTTNLGYLGNEYQLRLVKCFIEDQQFFINLCDIIDQNMFTDEHLRRIVALMKDRYVKSETVPTYKDIEVLIRTKIADTIAVEQCLSTIVKMRNLTFDAIDLIEDEAEKFFKQQNLSKALNKASEIIKKGNINDYYSIEDLIKKALETNTKQDYGFRLYENIETDLNDDYRQTISTGCKELDESLYGGLGKGELGLIVSPMGVGKAQPLTSKVLTPDGFKLMGEMNVGDEVIGRDGKAYKVTGVFPQGKRPIYKVSFSNGSSCECDIEHLWAVNTYWQRTRKTYVKGSGKKHPKKEFNPDNSFKVMTLKDMLEKGIYKETKGGYKTYVYKVPNNEAIDFNKREINIDPYVLGYYIGDGCYKRHEITIGKDDYENAKKNICEVLNGDTHSHFYENRNVWIINISKNSRIKLQEIVGKSAKSNEKSIPLNYLFNSKDVRIGLLQGLMDSDGTIDKVGHISFTTKSKQLAEDVKFLVRSLGGYANIRIKKNTFYYNKNGEKIECGDAYTVGMNFHNEEVKPFRFQRKLERMKYRKKYINLNYVTNIEYIREDEAQCIMVDSDEHLYLTDDFIVTHNTSVTTGFAASAATTKCELNNYQGFKVLHFFFEDKEQAIRRKYYGYALDIDACELSNPEIRPIAIKRLNEDNETKQMLKNNIIAKRLISGEVCASQIKNMIKKYISIGFKPDLVIIDYFECLKPEKSDSLGDSEWTKEAITMRKLEAICNEMNVAIWCPVQGTKGSIGIDIVGLQHAGGSVRKTQIGHIVLTLAQTNEQKEQGRLNLFIGKLRAVKIGRTSFKNVKFNNGTGKFDMSDLDETENELNSSGISNTAQSIAKSVKQEYRKNFKN